VAVGVVSLSVYCENDAGDKGFRTGLCVSVCCVVTLWWIQRGRLRHLYPVNTITTGDRPRLVSISQLAATCPLSGNSFEPCHE